MSEITYDDFEKLEEAKVTKYGYTEPKYDEKGFVLELLKERPYSRAELKKMSEEAGFVFSIDSKGYRPNVKDTLADMINEGVIESRYGSRGEIYYGLKRKEEK